jgi:hypothetical protein
MGTHNIIMSEDGREMSWQYVMKERTLPDLEQQVKGKSYLLKPYSDFEFVPHAWLDKSVSE